MNNSTTPETMATSQGTTPTGNEGEVPLVKLVVGCGAFVVGLTVGILLTYAYRHCCRTKRHNKPEPVERKNTSSNGSNRGTAKKSNHSHGNVNHTTRKAATLDSRPRRQLQRTFSDKYEYARHLGPSAMSSFPERNGKTCTGVKKETGGGPKKKFKVAELSGKQSVMSNENFKRSHSSDYDFARPIDNDALTSQKEYVVCNMGNGVAEFKINADKKHASERERERLHRKYSNDYEFAYSNTGGHCGEHLDRNDGTQVSFCLESGDVGRSTNTNYTGGYEMAQIVESAKVSSPKTDVYELANLNNVV